MAQDNRHAALVWPLGLTMGMTIVVLFNIYMAVLAVRTDPGTSEESPYERGVTYQHVLDGRAKFSARGWMYDMRFSRDEVTGLLAEVLVRDHTGAPVPGLEVSLRLQRPSTSTDDITLTLPEASPGVYRTIAPPHVTPGLWIERLRIRTDDLSAEFDATRPLP